MLVVLLACTSPGPAGHDSGTSPVDDSAPADDSAIPGDSDTDTGTIPLIQGSASIRENAANPFSAFVTVDLDHDARVKVVYGETDLDSATPEVAVPANQPTDILVLGLRAGRTFELRVDAAFGLARWSSDSLAFTTDPLPEGWPVCTPTFEAPESSFDPNEVVCTQGSTSSGADLYYCTDHHGEPVFELRTAQSDSLFSMEPLSNGGWAATSYNHSKLIVWDATGKEIEDYNIGALTGQTRFEHQYIDPHEMYEIREGQWQGDIAFLTNAYEYLSNSDLKIGNGVVVMDPYTGEVLYDYSFLGELGDDQSMDPLVPFTRPGIGDYEEDWTHANALLHGIDDDGREYFLVSLKAQDWIVKLYPDTDELAWALGYEGAFTLVDDIDAEKPVEMDSYDWFFHQHGMRFLDNSGPRLDLVMLDNGYPRHDENGPNWNLAYTRIVEVEVDQDLALAQLDFAYGDPAGDDSYFTSTCGNALLLPDGERAMAMIGETNTMLEVSYPEGIRRWSMTCETRDWCSYQVHWFPSIYDTTWMYE